MKKSEYDSIIQNLTNPDKIAEALVELSDRLTKDETEFNSLQESNNTLKTSNDTLRDTNAKLALRVTQPVQVQNTNEVDAWESFVNSFEEVANGVTN